MKKDLTPWDSFLWRVRSGTELVFCLISGIITRVTGFECFLICWAKEGMIKGSHERLFACPACPTGNIKIAERVKKEGIDEVLLSVPLLLDSSDSIGWQDWFDRAGLDLTQSQQGLSIADSNSCVQAIIDGQGIALWDRLVAYEINSGHLHYLSDIWLDE